MIDIVELHFQDTEAMSRFQEIYDGPPENRTMRLDIGGRKFHVTQGSLTFKNNIPFAEIKGFWLDQLIDAGDLNQLWRGYVKSILDLKDFSIESLEIGDVPVGSAEISFTVKGRRVAECDCPKEVIPVNGFGEVEACVIPPSECQPPLRVRVKDGDIERESIESVDWFSFVDCENVELHNQKLKEYLDTVNMPDIHNCDESGCSGCYPS